MKKRADAFLGWQLKVFGCVYLSYASYLFMRKSFSYIVPSLLQEFPSITKEQIGMVGTMMGLTYAVGKILLGGILADTLSPKMALFIGLTACGILNLCLAGSSSIWMMGIFWTINGLFQGGGWGPCAKLLMSWFPKETRGTWWGMAATSQSVGAGVGAVLCAYCAQEYGWRMGMVVPGLFGFVAAVE